MERDLASQKERDHGYEDVIEVQPYPLLTSRTNRFVQDPYQRPTFSFPAASLEGNSCPHHCHQM